MSKVTFDYSKAAPFIKDNEVESMKKLALDAKELLGVRQAQAMISWDGLTCR